VAEKEADIERLMAVVENPQTSRNGFDEAMRRIKNLLSMSK
jgi:uncharacterized protein (DUF1778 family)